MHEEYLDAGADMIETNTFSATTIGLHDFFLPANQTTAAKIRNSFERVVDDADLRDTAREINRRRRSDGTRSGRSRQQRNRRATFCGRRAWSPARHRFAFARCKRSRVSRRHLRSNQTELSRSDRCAYLKAASIFLLVETVFDTLNAKAALFAIAEAFEKNGRNVPLIISGTITDRSGRTLSGQTLEAFLTSIAHADPLVVGLNCALGPDEMDPFIEELARVAPTFVSAYPNAGLPDPLSETGFPETPETLRPESVASGRATAG